MRKTITLAFALTLVIVIQAKITVAPAQEVSVNRTAHAAVTETNPTTLPETITQSDEKVTEVNDVTPKPTPYIVTAYAVGDRYTPSHGITASGKRVQPGITAACPREIALGTRIDIEGVGQRVCLDRGGMIRGKHIDVYMTSEKTALKFGKQTLGVKIIEEESHE